MLFRVLAVVAALLLSGDAFSTSCSSTKKTPITECLVGDDGTGKWRGVWNGIAGAEENSKDEAHLYAPGLCDAKGMTVTQFCDNDASWRPEHWDKTTTTHACHIVWKTVKCGGIDCCAP